MDRRQKKPRLRKFGIAAFLGLLVVGTVFWKEIAAEALSWMYRSSAERLVAGLSAPPLSVQRLALWHLVRTERGYGILLSAVFDEESPEMAPAASVFLGSLLDSRRGDREFRYWLRERVLAAAQEEFRGSSFNSGLVDEDSLSLSLIKPRGLYTKPLCRFSSRTANAHLTTSSIGFPVSLWRAFDYIQHIRTLQPDWKTAERHGLLIRSPGAHMLIFLLRSARPSDSTR